MLKKAKKESTRPVQTNGAIETETQNQAPRGDAAEDAQTVIGEPFSIDAIIQGGENLILEGSMQGRVELEKHFFMIGLKGRFDGEICAREAIIKGRMRGRIKALEKVRIAKEADFIGEVKSKTIAIEGGAMVKGVFEIERKPQPKTEKAVDSPGKASPAPSAQSAAGPSQPRRGN